MQFASTHVWGKREKEGKRYHTYGGGGRGKRVTLHSKESLCFHKKIVINVFISDGFVCANLEIVAEI